MIALCVGMYRACSTWQYGVVGALLEKYRDGQRLGFVEGIRYAEKLAENPRTGPWAVLKAHDFHDGFGELLATGRAIGFYSYRDLRDVISSYMYKTGTDIETLREQGFLDLCVNNDRAWRAQPGMLVQPYADLIANPVAGVAAIARHLGLELPDGEAAAIADAMSLAANRRKVDSMSARLREQGVTLLAQDQTKFDPVSLLHWNHIRSQTGDADQDPTAAARRRIVEEDCRPWLIANGFDVAARATAHPPAIRTSYARGGVDIRLDRLYRGVKGTVFDFDADQPTTPNTSYHFFLRGWRGLNIATRAVALDEFAAHRRGDVNVACSLESADRAATILANLVTESRLQAPELVILNQATDADLVIPAILAAGWRPQVVVADQRADRANPATWRRVLEGSGYRVVPDSTGPSIWLRADLAVSVSLLALPLDGTDNFRRAGEAMPSVATVVPAPPFESAGRRFGSWVAHLGRRFQRHHRVDPPATRSTITRPHVLGRSDPADRPPPPGLPGARVVSTVIRQR